MTTFLFKWTHPASEVYVTGTFDGWKKTEKLEKVGDYFEKDVKLADADAASKIFYKFVVDGDWVTDHTAPRETDESGNVNNVLTPERIIAEAPATAVIMNSAAPTSTTAALAADAPLEKKDVEAKQDTPEGDKAKSDEATGLPGTFPETPSLDSATIGVNPLPAAPGALNPIKLAPGEKIPESVTAQGTTSHVKLDPESYEKSDTLPAGGAAILSSAAPTSTTAALAADAPIETKVPQVVKESQEKAHVDPEASAIPEEVREKAAVENELLDKVKAAPTTAEGTAGKGTEKTEATVDINEAAASVAAAAAAVGSAAIAGAVAAKDTIVEKASAAATSAQASATEAATTLPDTVKDKLPESVQSTVAGASKEEKREEVSPEVPLAVKDSIVEADKAPEAAANTAAVEDKKAVESELLKEVKPASAVTDTPKTEAPATETKTETKLKTKTEVAPTTEAKPVAKTDFKPETKAEAKPEPAAKAPANGAQVPAESSTPAKPSETTTSAEKKKKHRISGFFGKIKDKLSK